MTAPVVDTPAHKPSVVGGIRPDITPAQLVSLIPILAALLAAFGVYDVTPEQQDALTAAVGWAAALVLGDAGLRAGRALASAKTNVAAIQSETIETVTAPAPVVPPRVP